MQQSSESPANKKKERSRPSSEMVTDTLCFLSLQPVRKRDTNRYSTFSVHVRWDNNRCSTSRVSIQERWKQIDQIPREVETHRHICNEVKLRWANLHFKVPSSVCFRLLGTFSTYLMPHLRVTRPFGAPADQRPTALGDQGCWDRFSFPTALLPNSISLTQTFLLVCIEYCQYYILQFALDAV